MKVLSFWAPLFALATLMFSCGDDNNSGISALDPANQNANIPTSAHPEVTRLEFPKVKGGNSLILVNRTSDKYDPQGINYCVEWDADKKANRWTCYQMHKGYTSKDASYSGEWIEDPKLPNYARFSDTSYMYYRSGFDRGHICPSGDRLYSQQANDQTFYYTNMQPQYSAFNGSSSQNTAVWLNMESKVRDWTNQMENTDTIYVVKGGTIDKEEQILKRVKGQLIVPKYFFMALLMKNKEGYKALGFWAEHLPDAPKQLNLSNYVINIAQLQTLTGIDFFCNLPDATEKQVESLPVENVKRAWGLR